MPQYHQAIMLVAFAPRLPLNLTTRPMFFLLVYRI